MKIIGLTGNIGSGKTYIAQIFEKMNIPVFYADAEAKKLYGFNEVFEEVRNAFGENVFTNNVIDLKKLAEIVFNDEPELKKLENIIHPKLKLRIEEWINQNLENKFVIIESAILFESGFDVLTNLTIMICAPEEIRIQRVIKRDKTNESDVKKRISLQMTEDKKKQKADYIIDNDGTKSILPQIDYFFRSL